MSKSLKSIVVSTIVFALGVPTIASAAPHSNLQVKTITVSYADLNLHKTEGAQVLYRRLKSAAKQACGMRSLQIDGSLSRFAETKNCYRNSLDAAVVKADNEIVSGIHAG